MTGPGTLDLRPWLHGEALAKWDEMQGKLKRRKSDGASGERLPPGEWEGLQEFLHVPVLWEEAAQAVVCLLRARLQSGGWEALYSTQAALNRILEEGSPWSRTLACHTHCELIQPVYEALCEAYGPRGIWLCIDGVVPHPSTWIIPLEDYPTYREEPRMVGLAAVVFELPKPPKVLSMPMANAHVLNLCFRRMASVREVDATGMANIVSVRHMENLRMVTHLQPSTRLLTEACPRLEHAEGTDVIEARRCPRLKVHQPKVR